jgi:hypothetical protein
VRRQQLQGRGWIRYAHGLRDWVNDRQYHRTGGLYVLSRIRRHLGSDQHRLHSLSGRRIQSRVRHFRLHDLSGEHCDCRQPGR